MHTITIHYDLKWRIKHMPHICISSDRTVINTRTGRILSEKKNGGSIGYWIGRKFITENRMNDFVERIPPAETPWD